MKILGNRFMLIAVLTIIFFITAHILVYFQTVDMKIIATFSGYIILLAVGSIFYIWFFMPFRLHYNVIGYSFAFLLTTLFYVIITKSFETLLSGLTLFWTIGIVYLYFKEWKVFDKYSKTKEDRHEELKYSITGISIIIILMLMLSSEFQYAIYAGYSGTEMVVSAIWAVGMMIIVMLWIFYHFDKKQGKIKTPEDAFLDIKLSSYVTATIALLFLAFAFLAPLFLVSSQSILALTFTIIMGLVTYALWESYANRKRYEYFG